MTTRPVPTRKSAVNQALKILNHQAYSEQKVADKLEAAGFSQIEVAECLCSLRNWRYVNDREFGANRIKQLQERLKSRSYTTLDLENQGLPKELVAELINSFYSEDQELVIARKLLQKKVTSHNNPSKMWVFLVRAGFTENTVRHCFPGIDPT